MKSDEQMYDVLIVGCSPTGATLANILRLSSHRVAIFDRDKAIFSAPRAMQIDAESARVFQSIGVQQRLGIEDARPLVGADGATASVKNTSAQTVLILATAESGLSSTLFLTIKLSGIA